ncbi:hypothetical protein BDR22DRAFT_103551 [Usnea florida]
MENYLETREQWLFPGLLSIRSIGIKKFPLSWKSRWQQPWSCEQLAVNTGLDATLVNFMSYFYTAMAITIPESFSWSARPLISIGSPSAGTWFQLNNSNGANPPSSLSALQNNAGAETTSPEGTMPASSDVAPFSTLGSISFARVTDTAHTNTENCFTYLPSVSVQGRQSEVCDCGTTTAALTTQGLTTGCALGNSIIPINNFPTPRSSVSTRTTPMAISNSPISNLPTPTSSASTTITPMVISATPLPTRAFEIMSKVASVNVGFQDLTVDDWSVYSHPPGNPTMINACDGGFFSSSASYSGFATALGPFQGHGVNTQYSGCVYQGPKTAAGSVSCPGMATWAACSAAPASTQQCANGAGYDIFTAQADCSF